MAAWTHALVYNALVEWGERQKKSDNNKYVCLYDQRINCAILYRPDSISFARAPIHLNKNGERRAACWKGEVFAAIRPCLSYVRTDSKPDPDQQFDQYAVNDWSALADALGLTHSHVR